jgi:hypothetical protein
LTRKFINELFPFKNNIPLFSPSRRPYEPEATIPFFSRHGGTRQKFWLQKTFVFPAYSGIEIPRRLTSVHPEMVDLSSGQGRSVFATTGVVWLRRGLQKGENAALG